MEYRIVFNTRTTTMPFIIFYFEVFHLFYFIKKLHLFIYQGRRKKEPVDACHDTYVDARRQSE